MPEYIKKALMTKGLMEAYSSRPAYQRNDYLGWIGRAKLETTRQKRFLQMLEELKAGNKYMKMDYKADKPEKLNPK